MFQLIHMENIMNLCPFRKLQLVGTVANWVVYRGSRGIKILTGLETVDYRPRKWPEMLEIMSFDDAAIVVYRGSRGIEILPGPEN